MADVDRESALFDRERLRQPRLIKRIDVAVNRQDRCDRAQRIEDDAARRRPRRAGSATHPPSASKQLVRNKPCVSETRPIMMRPFRRCVFATPIAIFLGRFLEILTAGQPDFPTPAAYRDVSHAAAGGTRPGTADELGRSLGRGAGHAQRGPRRADRQHSRRRRIGAPRRSPGIRRGSSASSCSIRSAGDAAERLSRALDELAACARVCLFPAMHRYRLDDERVSATFEAAAAHGAAVFVHCGVLTVGVRKKLGLPSPFDLRLGDPLALATVAARFPKVPVIIPHFGAGILREALMAADQCPNIHLDTSSSNRWVKYYPGLTLEDVFRQALAIVGPDRLIFGTDSSFFPRGWQRQIFELQKQTLRSPRRAGGCAGANLLGQLRAVVSVADDSVESSRAESHELRANVPREPSKDWSRSRCVRHLIRLDDSPSSIARSAPWASPRSSRRAQPWRRRRSRPLPTAGSPRSRPPPEVQALAARGGRIVALGSRCGRQALHRAGHRSDRSRRPVRDAWLHRGPRPLHRRGPGAAAAEPDEGDELGRDRRDGRGRGEDRPSPDSGSSAAAGTRRNGRRVPSPNVEGFPDSRVADAVSPNNPVVPHARQRPRQLRQRQGDGAVGHRRRHAESRRRRNPEGRGRQADRNVARDRLAADSHRRRRAGADGRGAAARARQVLELASAGSAVEGRHVVPGRGS